MPNWNTRLVVSYIDEDNNNVTVTPIDSFSPSFALTGDVLHSIEQTHIGMIYSPQAITFTMTVKAIGPAAALLTTLALNRKSFEIHLQSQPNGHDWAFASIVLSNCHITSAAPTAASPTGAPTATFSGVSLSATSTDTSGSPNGVAKIPAAP
jgi:hypothetical protein